MADNNQDYLSNIANYAAKARTTQADQMEVDDQAAVEARLDQTISEMQNRLQQQQRALEELRSTASNAISTRPSSDPQEHLKQLHVIKAAYDHLTPSEPDLPSPGSLLPAVLATRNVQQSISSTKAAVNSTQSGLASTEHLLHEEGRNLDDAKLLETALNNRIERLRAQQLQQSQKSSSESAREMLQTKQKRRQDYSLETERLQTALSEFIEQSLAPMLAAEELGGPVVGDLIDVDEELLEGSFSVQGKPKPSKPTGASGQDSKRQRRIDEIWGPTSGGGATRERTEKEAAAAEIRELVNELFNALLGDNGTGVYVQLDRDSAAARFLVRAKVAQFHPKDARRLRLVDFGRELDD